MEDVKFINVDDLMNQQKQLNIVIGGRCSGKTAALKASCLKWVNEEIKNLQVSINRYRKYKLLTTDPFKIRLFNNYLTRWEQKQEWFKYIKNLMTDSNRYEPDKRVDD